MPERLLTLRELTREALARQMLLDREALSRSEDPNDLVLRYLVVFPCRREGLPGVVGVTRMKEIVGVLRPECARFATRTPRSSSTSPSYRVPVDAPRRYGSCRTTSTLTSRAGRRREMSNEHRKKVILSAARVRRTFSW